MNYKVIDVSNIKSGEEFVNKIINSKSNCIEIIGEKENPVLKKMYEPEIKQKFNIGDTVKLAKDMLDFNGIKDDGKKFIIYGVTKVNDQFLYEIDGGWTFFGYELEKA